VVEMAYNLGKQDHKEIESVTFEQIKEISVKGK